MSLFKTKFSIRLAIAKTIGFIFWLIWFFILPIMFGEKDLMLRLAILFWYTTLWGIIWIFGIMDKHPVLNFSMPFWFRWSLMWAWMNFLLVLFIYDRFVLMMQGTIIDWISPFWIIIEWVIIWIIIDFFATKFAWEGKKLVK